MIKWGKFYIDIAQNTIWRIHVTFYDPQASFKAMISSHFNRQHFWVRIEKSETNPYQERLDISINQENSIAFSSSMGIYCSQGQQVKSKQ